MAQWEEIAMRSPTARLPPPTQRHVLRGFGFSVSVSVSFQILGDSSFNKAFPSSSSSFPPSLPPPAFSSATVNL